MNKEHTQLQETPMGFWERLAFAFEPLVASYEERLEKRILRLETEVSRLSRIHNEERINNGRRTERSASESR